MKLFTKIALVSAMAMSANAMASQLQALDDETLSATTGQDGITINVGLGLDGIKIGQVYLHDNDGLAANSLNTGNIVGQRLVLNSTTLSSLQTALTDAQTALAADPADPALQAAVATAQAAVDNYSHYDGTSNVSANSGATSAGAIIINNLSLKQVGTGDFLTLKIDTDGASSSEGAFLNINAQVAAQEIGIGGISVGKSNTYDHTTAKRGATDAVDIITGFTLNLGALGANIQLGNTPQGAMIVLNTDIQGGLDITGLGIKDAEGGGTITLDSIAVRGDNPNGDLNVRADISVKTDGLYIVSNSNQDINTYIGGIHLGSRTGTYGGTPGTASTSSIGDLEINGLNLSGSTVRISGH